MRLGFRWKRAGGVALMAVVTLFVIVVFSLLCVTDKMDEDLVDTDSVRHGWSYELLIDGGLREYEPEFEGEYLFVLPEESQAVRITRVMTEEIPRAELEWRPSILGMELFLGDELIYSDFPNAARDANGFVRSPQESARLIFEKRRDHVWQKVRMSLPDDYLGKELSVITYFPEGWESPQPEFPILGSEDSAVANVVVGTTIPTTAMVICAILALLLMALFLSDLFNGKADSKALLLCLCFLLLFLDLAYTSDAGNYGLLRKKIDLRFLSGLYVAPLYLFLSLRLKKVWKYPLCVGTVAWALYEGTRMFLNLRRGQNVLTGRSGMGAFVLFLAVVAAMGVETLSYVEGKKRRGGMCLAYACVTVVVAGICAFSAVRSWKNVYGYLVDGVWGSLRAGEFQPAVKLIASISATMATIALISEFIRRTIRTRQEMSALQERTRQTMESYERLLTAEGATRALRHEMRHHLTALSGILQDGDIARASRYISAISGDLEQLPTGRYSRNILVNVIAGSYLDRARAQWIQVEHRLNVPPELHIADEDLSVFLSNMLQNALEACEHMDPEAKRYIQVEMRLRGNFLFIKCVNSAPEKSKEETKRPGHGYGLAAMRRIAEKYDSVLLVEHSMGEFVVKSDLCLKRSEAKHSVSGKQVFGRHNRPGSTAPFDIGSC